MCPHAPGLVMAAFALYRLPLPQGSDPAPGVTARQWAGPELMGHSSQGVPGREPGPRTGSARYLKWRCRMDLTAIVVDIVMFLVIVAIGASLARAWRTRPARARLVALPPEARRRYVSSWSRIEKQFMDSPETAVQDADSLITALLGERGHPLGVDRLPRRLRSARRRLARGQKRHRTEDLRLARLEFRAVFEQMIGPEAPEPVPEGRRETA